MPSMASRKTPSRSTQMSWVFSRPSRCTLKKKRWSGWNSLQALLDEHAVGAEVDVPVALQDSRHQLADLRIHHGLAAADGDHGRAALIHRRQALFERHALGDGGSYSRMRPQPVQVRLQACSGSSISTIGKRLLIMGCGWRFSPVLAGRMRNGLAASGAGATVFCHSGRGRILFLKMYPAMPAVIAKGNFIIAYPIRIAPRLHERSQGQQREIILVQVIVQIENLGETGAGGQFFVPASVGALRFQQVFDAVLHAQAVGVAAGDQAQNGPGGLRRRAAAPA